jgi:hypothetical protein
VALIKGFTGSPIANVNFATCERNFTRKGLLVNPNIRYDSNNSLFDLSWKAMAVSSKETGEPEFSF